MIDRTDVHNAMVRTFAGRSLLDDDDRAAIHALPFLLREVRPSAYIVDEGADPTRCAFLFDGFSFRQRLTNRGARQILSIQIPGEFVDLQNLHLKRSDHSVQALTRAIIAEVPLSAMRQLALSRPSISNAMWIEALVEASMFREWIMNVGRRNALVRVAHIICEFTARLEAAGVSVHDGYLLPMTQEQLGDAVGLTAVHVNRTLRRLHELGLVERDGYHIVISDRKGLRAAAGFRADYLHLDQNERSATGAPVQATLSRPFLN